MKIELEFSTQMNDKSEVLTKISHLVKTASELGFNLEEVELESDSEKDREKEKHKDEKDEENED
jgi:hypothetical protein